MENYDVLTLEHKKKGHMDLYKETLIEVVGTDLPWKEVKELDRKILRKMAYTLERKIKLHESPIDVKKLARAIQHSRSGIGGCAMTTYTCHFCEKEEIWGNTAVPKICLDCATKMATNIVMNKSDIWKESEKSNGKR